jgi:DNA-binding CsgD family transcriptional regulator
MPKIAAFDSARIHFRLEIREADQTSPASVIMPSVGADPHTAMREISSYELGRVALRIADCRSLASLKDAIFDQANAVVGAAAAGLYMLDRGGRMQLVGSRLAPQGFLDEYERDFAKDDAMLDYILAERRSVDGFHFYGPARWHRSGNRDILRAWGFFHNIGGVLTVDGEVVGAMFVASVQDQGPFAEVQVERFDTLCRAGSLALTTMRGRERLWCHVFNPVAGDRSDARLGQVQADVDGSIEGSVIDPLPPRARRVAALLCEGRPNKFIASELGISVYTVKEHVQNLCRRFGACNRTDLVQRLLTRH